MKRDCDTIALGLGGIGAGATPQTDGSGEPLVKGLEKPGLEPLTLLQEGCVNGDFVAYPLAPDLPV